ncbi:MAG: YhgE/Pip domain-containing protein [Clostridium butyricum]|nr:YhgE/Pip domain-containing protein [Clostridium butyricum]
MKNVFRIYKRDIKRICTNWAALIMAIILIIIPSLYSLINIKASWDPYSNTNGLKIAVVNKDIGTIFKEQDINLGKKLVEELEDNSKMGWEFTDEDSAKSGLKEEKYYASIVIPEDFSEAVTTVSGKNVTKPKLIYTVNEKKNSIAPKITDAGVKNVKNQVDDIIVKTISGIMLRIFNETGIEIDGRRPNIRKVIDEIYELNEQMPELECMLDEAIDGTGQINSLLNKTNEIIPTVSDALGTTDDFLSDSKEFVDDIQSELADISPTIKEDLLLSENVLDSTSTKLKNLDKNIIPEVVEKSLISAKDTAEATQTTVQATKNKLTKIKKFLNKLINYELPDFNLDVGNDKTLNEIKDKIDVQYSSFEDMKDSFRKINKSIDIINDKLDKTDEKLGILIKKCDEKLEKLQNGEGLDTQTLEDITEVTDEIHMLVSDVIDSYDSEIVNGIESGFDSVRLIVDSSMSIVKEANDTLPNLQDLLSSSFDITDYSNEELLKLKDKFPDIKDKISEISNKLRELDDDGKFDEILDMVTNDWDSQSDFLSSPVEIEDNRLFPIPNYGTASTPFYTVLCLWVGALIGSALLTFEVDELEEGVPLKSYEIYLGKLLTFLTFAILEAIVASIGAIRLLGVYTVHPFMFVFYCIFVSIIFTLIIYTAASLLDDVGKSIIVVLLVLQLAGTGGTFPIEVAPEMFKKIYMYLPFTYATNGMREIVGGIVYKILIKDVLYLCIYGGVSLVMGLTLKRFLNKITEPIFKKLFSSGILKH